MRRYGVAFYYVLQLIHIVYDILLHIPVRLERL